MLLVKSSGTTGPRSHFNINLQWEEWNESLYNLGHMTGSLKFVIKHRGLKI